MRVHFDEEAGIETEYHFLIEGIEVKFNDRLCPGATCLLYRGTVQDGGGLLCTPLNCMSVCIKELLWTPPTSKDIHDGVVIGYWGNGYMRYEMIATPEEVNEIASRAEYDGQDVAHITVTHTLSIGTSTVWIKVKRNRSYGSRPDVDVRLCVEFGNSEECTLFLHEDMTRLEDRYVHDIQSHVAVINDIMCALFKIWNDYISASRKAIQRRIPYSQFVDEYPQPETQFIRHRDSNRGHDRPCYLPCTLRLGYSPYLLTLAIIDCVTIDWGAIHNFPTHPPHSFRSLNSLHLNFPPPTQHYRHNPSQNSTDPLSLTLEATGIHGLTATNSVAQGNLITIASEHRNVQVNLAGLHGISVNINFVSGDSYFGAISSSNIGGTNNVNTIRISSPVGFCSPRLTESLPRSRHTPLQPEQAESQGGVGR